MTRCLRRRANVLAGFVVTVSALALLWTDAVARPDPHNAARKTQEAKAANIKAANIKAANIKAAPAAKTPDKAADKTVAKTAAPAAKTASPADKSAAAPAKRRVARHEAPAKKANDDEADAPKLTGDLAKVKEAIALARKGKTADATDIENTITDPAAIKLVEWFILRHSETTSDYSRYAVFMSANPDWPSMALLRKRAEGLLWAEHRSNGAKDVAWVHEFTGNRPTSAKGKLAVARVLLAEGDREGAARLVREAWRSEELSEATEADAAGEFGDLLTRDDHRARMDKRIGAKDLGAARRAAQRLGSDYVAIVKACSAVRGKDDKASRALDDVPESARGDLGYTLCRLQWLLAQNKIDDAAHMAIEAARETMDQQDTDQWWRERRLLARKLLDQGKFQTAYDVVRPAAVPAMDVYRADYHFMCGWIALRYLNDPLTARAHFARIDEGSQNPLVLARANYWRGRVAETLGEKAEMETSYAAAARYPTAYYGQLARAKLGLSLPELRLPADVIDDGAATDERVRAADMLYEIGERDVVLYFVADLAEQTTDTKVLAALGELTLRRNDARSMLQIGKPALARGLSLPHYAFPTIGIPKHNPIAPDIGRSMTYAVARTESAFDQKDRSSAEAVGLMQVTPEAGRDTAKRFGVSYDWDRMVSDPVYNTQMGAAELSALVSEYRGSEIMIFAGYNAGRGRVRDWVKAYGDPRDPNVDPVDWVERIPFSETRNYVQRVMENMKVYHMRFDGNGAAITTATVKADQPARPAGPTLVRETSAAPGSP